MKIKLLITVSSLSILSILETQDSQAMELDDNTNKTTFFHQKKKDEHDEGRVERLPDLLQNNPDTMPEVDHSSEIISLDFGHKDSERLIAVSSLSILTQSSQAMSPPDVIVP